MKQHPSIYVVPNIEAEFPGRTRNEIFWKFAEKTPKHRHWTAEEVRTLKESRLAGESWISIQKKIPDRSIKSIRAHFSGRTRAQHPPLQAENSRKPWSTDDIAEVVRLREHDRLEWHDIGKRLGRSLQSVYGVFSRNVVSQTRPWSKEEESVLKELVEARKTYSEISKILDRTLWSVGSKVDSSILKNSLKKTIRPWTQVETDILEGAIRQDVELAHLQSHLPHRTREAIRVKLWKLQLKNQGQGLVRGRPKHSHRHHWTASDHAIFEAAWHEGLSEQQIEAKLPHVPLSSIKARSRKTRQPHVRTHWKPEEDDIISNALREGVDINQLQAQLPMRSLSSVKKRLDVKRKEIYKEEGVYLGRIGTWSPDEQNIISKANDEGLKLKDLTQMLPGRTKSMIRSKLYNIRLSKRSSE